MKKPNNKWIAMLVEGATTFAGSLIAGCIFYAVNKVFLPDLLAAELHFVLTLPGLLVTLAFFNALNAC